MKTNESEAYMRQLDGIRAIAVILVLVHHLISVGNLPFIFRHIPYGYLGVRLFFVLSGFLITGILLRERAAVEQKRITVKYALRQFYIRRFLRIFPLYYFVIAVILLIGLEGVSTHWLSLLTYTFNIELSIQGWYPAYISHFWSLSVEEQYYIFWPWLILLAPRRYLIPVTLFLVVLAPVYRCFAYLTGLNGIAIYTFTFSSLDALGIGSLLSIMSSKREWQLSLDRVLTGKSALLFLSLAVLLQVLLKNGHGWSVYIVLFEFVVAFLFAWAVKRASVGFQGISGRILENEVLVYLGKISYGIYVYHLFSPQLVRAGLEMFGIELVYKGRIEFAISTLMTIMMASLSWYLMESPINNLKRRYQYVPSGKPGG